MPRFCRRLAAIFLLAALALSTSISIASAGGSWMYPVKDRYEPGETATMVGYFGGGAFGPVADEPYFAYLQRIDGNGSVLGEKLPVGELEVSKADFQWRAAISFDLPADLAPGEYFLDYCTAGCERRMGDLVGGYVYVGVSPSYPPSRSWPPDEPEIANLADDVVLWFMGLETTAAEVRSGLRVPDDVPERHADYPQTTLAPPASVDESVGVATAAPSPTATTPPQLTDLPVVALEPVLATADAIPRPAEGRFSFATMLVAIMATGAIAIVGRQLLGQRSNNQ